MVSSIGRRVVRKLNRVARRLGIGETSVVRSSDRGGATAAIDPTAVIYSSASIQTQQHPPQFIEVGPNSHIRGELLLFGHGGRIRIGSYCYVGEQTRIWSAKEILIGDRVLISHLVTIMDSLTHPLDPAQRHEQFRAIVTSGHPSQLDLDERSVIIDDDVLIGCHSVVLRGVRIGKGAVIGAGSVVTTDIPPLAIAAGNPARVVRMLDVGEKHS